jgi:hypothetical protein
MIVDIEDEGLLVVLGLERESGSKEVRMGKSNRCALSGLVERS